MKIKKNHLLRKLELENGIKISIQTLNKIINNKY